MYLYRALNEYEEKEFENYNELYCNFILHRNDKEIKRLWNIKNSEVKNYGFSLALDRIIGHVTGASFTSSMWISSSKDFNFVCREYAIMQAGNYNTQINRKNIAVLSDIQEMDVKNARNITNIDEINALNGQAIDLSENKLLDYYNQRLINAYESNEHALNVSYKVFEKYEFIDGKFVYVPSDIKGFNGYSKNASEVLFFKCIKKENIKYILNPLMQDIIFAYTNNLNIQNTNNIIDKIYNQYKGYIPTNLTNEELNIFNYLYTANNNQYNSLVSLIEDTFLYNKDIEKDYDILKEIKRNILKKITNLDNIELVDDFIYVCNSKESTKKINKKAKYDIIYLQDNNTLYKHQKNKYIKVKTFN